jgi:hypothetical protein
VSVALTNEVGIASRGEFILYWGGFVILIVGAVFILMTISGLMVDVLSYRCWYPILSPMLGVNEPPKPTQVTDMPYYCTNLAVGVVRFVFNLFAGLIAIGAGGYMMLNGKKR